MKPVYLEKGLSLARKHYPLVLMALGLDILQLGDIMRRTRGFHFKFTIPTAVPSLTQVLPDVQSGGGLSVNLPFGFAGGAALVAAMALLLLAPYLKGGFLGCVLAGVRGEAVDTETFFRNAGRYFLRFIQQFLVLLVAVLIAAPFLLVLAPLAVLIVMVASFYLLFWDYSIVVEDTGVIEAARTSWNLVLANTGEVFSFVLSVALLAAVFSIVANFLVGASPVTAALAVGAYAYLGTAAVFAVMAFYLGLAGRRELE